MILPVAGKVPYSDKILALSPFAYFPMNEVSGTTAYCLVDSAQNGTYARDVSVMGTTPGIGDGNTAPLFNGTSDYLNILTAAFLAALDGDEFTVSAWAKVSGIGVWSDATDRCIMQAADTVGWANYWRLKKTTTANQLALSYCAGGVNNQSFPNRTNFGITDNWFNIALTHSKSDDEYISYINGIELETETGLGTWGATPNICVIGAYNTTPAQVWSGGIQHVVFFDRALTPAEIVTAAKV